MSQARQIHSYALAVRRGWYPDGGHLVDQAFASMVADFHRADGGRGWIFSIHSDGRPADPRRDLYSHAFVLLAIATYVRLTGRREALLLADETLEYLDCHMASPAGGFIEQLPGADSDRRQNPHMHLFEALLALWECSQDGRYLERAHSLFELFTSRFFRPDCGALLEYYTAGLAPAQGIRGRLVEPGHHYEWVWLLRRFEAATAVAPAYFVDALYSHADRHGFDAQGLIVDEVLAEGGHHSRSRRIWPVTEAIKANLVEARHGRAGAARKAADLTELLREHFLHSVPAGGWIDRLDAAGRCASDYMPASTLYHLIGALEEWTSFRSAQGAEGAPGRVPKGSGCGSATRCPGPDRPTSA